ncbi:hypothetical protein K443DRAFT_391964 [Laccaria amethystina LaAM-08-1]|uniref:Uncharacterized protein n=1 Tax=Laccaria amethystina LaAM-08-1 TaxID=1095629 RepID=A0A0C9YGY9_9AGAR|nr:hypothetical protein K443DRAFT_391964 [Laccaria amethystina LaAM-08-1]
MLNSTLFPPRFLPTVLPSHRITQSLHSWSTLVGLEYLLSSLSLALRLAPRLGLIPSLANPVCLDMVASLKTIDVTLIRHIHFCQDTS